MPGRDFTAGHRGSIAQNTLFFKQKNHLKQGGIQSRLDHDGPKRQTVGGGRTI